MKNYSTWLQQQPLLHYDKQFNVAMIHAGFAPSWDLQIAKNLAHEVEVILRGEHATDFFQQMYGNFPNAWDESLQGWERIRCIVNYFTRARFCFADGSLDLMTKENMLNVSADLIPWFKIPNRRSADIKIIFGHWAALGGITNTPDVFALDTGCVWGYCLSAMRLEDQKKFSVSCK